MLIVQINTLILQVKLYLIICFEAAIVYHMVKLILCSLLKLLCKKNSDASLSVKVFRYFGNKSPLLVKLAILKDS